VTQRHDSWISVVSAIFEPFRNGIFLLDDNARPLVMNAAARRHVSPEGLMYQDGNESLRARDSRLDRALRDAISAAVATLPKVLPVDQEGRRMALWATRLDVAGEPVVMIALVTDAPPVVESALLSEMLGISQAEAKLVCAMMTGQSLTDYANEAGLSYNTVRNQLRSVMAKTQAGSQIELLLTVERLAPPLHH